jgi:hypothetical protein
MQIWKAVVIKHLHALNPFGQMFTPTDFIYVSFKHIFISQTNFMGIPKSMGILYNSFLIEI